MLIMNQSKNQIVNLVKTEVIEVRKNAVIVGIGGQLLKIGTYADESRAKAVLMELYEQYKSYKAAPSDDGKCGVILNRAFEMPDK